MAFSPTSTPTPTPEPSGDAHVPEQYLAVGCWDGSLHVFADGGASGLGTWSLYGGGGEEEGAGAWVGLLNLPKKGSTLGGQGTHLAWDPLSDGVLSISTPLQPTVVHVFDVRR